MQATYSSLAPGHYSFLLKACNNDGIWNNEPVRFNFEIMFPFWKKWWFYMISILLFLSIIGIIIRLLINKVNRKKKEEEEKLNQQINHQKAINSVMIEAQE